MYMPIDALMSTKAVYMSRKERIVVQVTPAEKRAIVSMAAKMRMSISDLMRKGALAYRSAASLSAELDSMTDGLGRAIEAACQRVDEVATRSEETRSMIAALPKQITLGEPEAVGG